MNENIADASDGFPLQLPATLLPATLQLNRNNDYSKYDAPGL